jgi:exonuclease VII large subunit
MAAQRVYSVGQVNSYIKTMFATDYLLKNSFCAGGYPAVNNKNSEHIFLTFKVKTAKNRKTVGKEKMEGKM